MIIGAFQWVSEGFHEALEHFRGFRGFRNHLECLETPWNSSVISSESLLNFPWNVLKPCRNIPETSLKAPCRNHFLTTLKPVETPLNTLERPRNHIKPQKPRKSPKIPWNVWKLLWNPIYISPNPIKAPVASRSTSKRIKIYSKFTETSPKPSCDHPASSGNHLQTHWLCFEMP